jgi:hypothetical protein
MQALISIVIPNQVTEGSDLVGRDLLLAARPAALKFAVLALVLFPLFRPPKPPKSRRKSP